MISRHRIRASAILIVTAWAASTNSVLAEVEPQRYQISKADFGHHTDALELEAEDRLIAKQLFQQYTDDFLKTCEVYSVINAWYDSNGGVPVKLIYGVVNTSVGEDRRRLALDFHKSLRELASRYFRSLELVAEGRSEDVTSLRMAHLRKRMIGHDPRLQWNNASTGVDLLAMMTEVSPNGTKDPNIRTILNGYEGLLDDVLRQVDDLSAVYERDADAELRELARKSAGETPDIYEVERIARLYLNPVELSVRFRALNRTTIDQLLSALPTAEAIELRILTDRAMYDYLYVEDDTNYLRRIHRVLEAGKLDDSKRNDLLGLRDGILDLNRDAGRVLDRLNERRSESGRLREVWERWVVARLQGTAFHSDPDDFEDVARKWRSRLEPYKELVRRELAQIVEDE